MTASPKTRAETGAEGPGEAKPTAAVDPFERSHAPAKLLEELRELVTPQASRPPPTLAELRVRREEEALRQQKEAFDEEKNEGARWNRLRLAMGWAALVVFIAVAVVSLYILLRPDAYDPWAARAAVGTLLAFAATVWRLMLGRAPRKLEAVTRLEGEAPAQERLPV